MTLYRYSNQACCVCSTEPKDGDRIYMLEEWRTFNGNMENVDILAVACSLKCLEIWLNRKSRH